MKRFFRIFGFTVLGVLLAYVGYRAWEGVDLVAMRQNPDMIPVFIRAELGDVHAQHVLGLAYKIRMNLDWVDNVNIMPCGSRAIYWLVRANSNGHPLSQGVLDDLMAQDYTIRDMGLYRETSERCW